jgi:hypothetical protein
MFKFGKFSNLKCSYLENVQSWKLCKFQQKLNSRIVQIKNYSNSKVVQIQKIKYKKLKIIQIRKMLKFGNCLYLKNNKITNFVFQI